MATGKIISQIIHEGVSDWVHGGGHRVRRLIVSGWAITHDKDSIYVFPWDDAFAQDDKSLKVIAEDVEVSDTVIAIAQNYFNAKLQLHKALDTLGCSTEAAETRQKESVAKWKAWADAERAKGVRDILYEPKRFLED